MPVVRPPIHGDSGNFLNPYHADGTIAPRAKKGTHTTQREEKAEGGVSPPEAVGCLEGDSAVTGGGTDRYNLPHMSDLTIGQLAAAAGVAASTVRFYEREKLLAPDARTGAGYRTYTRASLERLKFIRAAQGSGFNLSDIREMLALTHSDEPPCKEIATLIEHRLADVRARMTELKRVARALDSALKNCCRGGTDWCNEVDRLRKRPRGTCDTAGEKNRCTPLTLH